MELANRMQDCFVPDIGQVFLDHVGLFVADLDAIPAWFTRLGFTLTPRATHMHRDAAGHETPSGTSNHCAMFREGYLEILGATADTPLAAQLTAGLTRYPGAHLIAFAAADADVRHAALDLTDLAPLPLVHLQRPIDVDGSPATGRFSVVRMPPGSMPEGRIQIVTHHTPELVWQPRFLTHANGVEALTEVLVCVGDPAEAADRFGRLLARPARAADGAADVDLNRGCLRFLTPDRLARELPDLTPPSLPFIAAVGFRCPDLAATGRYFADCDIPVVARDGTHLRLPASEAFGLTMLFRSADKDD